MAIAGLMSPALSEPQGTELFARLISNYARNVLQSWRRTKEIYESRATYGKCEFNKTLGCLPACRRLLLNKSLYPCLHLWALTEVFLVSLYLSALTDLRCRNYLHFAFRITKQLQDWKHWFAEGLLCSCHSAEKAAESIQLCQENPMETSRVSWSP